MNRDDARQIAQFTRLIRSAKESDISAMKKEEMTANFHFMRDFRRSMESRDIKDIQNWIKQNGRDAFIENVESFTQDSYYAIQLMQNESFVYLPAEVKSVFFRCCHEFGLDSQIRDVIVNSIQLKNQEERQKKEIAQRLSGWRITPFPTSSLPTVNDIEPRFVAFSLSQECLSAETDATLLLQRVMDCMSNPDRSQLQNCVHEMCSDLESPQSLTVLFTAFILTFIPVLSIQSFPSRAGSSKPSPFREAQYVVWKTIACYFRSCQWSAQDERFEESDTLNTAIASVHPFVLFLCSFYSDVFFEAITPFLCAYSLFCVNSHRMESNERFLLLWGCFLRLCDGVRRERVTEVVWTVRRQVAQEELPSFDRFFRVV